MPGVVVPVLQSLFVLSLPGLLMLAPSEGAVRATNMGHASTAMLVNAMIGVEGRIVAARPDGSLILAGRRDRIARALLPMGVIVLPTQADGCYPKRRAEG